MKRIGRFIRRHPFICVAIYLIAIALNWHVEYLISTNRNKAATTRLIGDNATSLTLQHDPQWNNSDQVLYHVLDRGPRSSTPVVLLHGTPGAAIGLNSVARSLSHDRRVVWFDLPGFASQAFGLTRFTGLSAETYADVTFAILDELGIERAHIVGWSNGGAVALHMADDRPDRVASVTMLASVGAQQTEGSGSYFFEHTKYKLGDLVLNKLDILIPHFGLLGPSTEREAFIRNFDETDQRKLTRIMPTIEQPALILHGRNDFLTSDWAAEHHHELMPTSTLIMTPWDHFMPFMKPAETAAYIEEFVSRHDEPGVVPLRETIDLAPRRTPFGAIGERLLHWLHFGSWHWHVVAVCVVALVLRKLGIAWVAVLVGATELDIGVAWVGLSVAYAAQMVLINPRSVGAWFKAIAAPGVMLVVGLVLTQLVFRPIGLAMGEFGWLLSTVLLAVLLHIRFRVFTSAGRRELGVEWSRLRHHEWWPTWAMHAPAVPVMLKQSIRHRHPLVFTCCNPGITPGGGIGGESKLESLEGLLAADTDQVLFGCAAPNANSVDERTKLTLELIESETRLGGFPVMLKPDRGEQARGVTKCNDAGDVKRYFEKFDTDSLVQRYHPGPCELGVFWVRNPAAESGMQGRVFSCCRKVMPELECDGTRTIRDHIRSHHRYRIQAEQYEQQLADRLDDVPEAGTRITLTNTANHKAGAIFRQAPELVTNEFERTIDSIAAGFVAPNGGGFDFGRFDVRYTDGDSLKRGEGLAIVEVNGVTSEAIDIYDPDRSAWFAWGILREQWKLAYEIGAKRRAEGVKPMGMLELAFGARRHLKDRPSS
ncbi:MAG: alpha/beta fold hydrolase [Phycisphaera sp.]|nr:MAG: alpha/beta fold hydrolase [Phycisphaera sp.]